MKADKTLILFYSSSCPHCQTLIAYLAELSKNMNTLKVFAISLDTSRSDWTSFIRNNNLNWINVNDLKGWSGSAASDYFIYATPTMFLVDKDKKILAKPVTVEELMREL